MSTLICLRKRQQCLILGLAVTLFIGTILDRKLVAESVGRTEQIFMLSPSEESSFYANGNDHHDDMANTNSAAPTCVAPNVQPVRDCLSMTSDRVDRIHLHYPIDAIEHFYEIHRVMDVYSRDAKMLSYYGYGGPWMENVWIDMSWERIKSSNNNATTTTTWMDQEKNGTDDLCAPPLTKNFGPYIPLLIPWVNIWADSNSTLGGWQKYPTDFFATLDSLLRPDVAYVTVSHNGNGLAGFDEYELPKNLLVLSAGGYGHVPIPLILRDEPLLRTDEERKKKSHKRSFLINYVGSLDNDPWRHRHEMNAILNNTLGDQYKYCKCSSWRDIMKDSWVSMTPRGFGRTAFHVAEALQMGLIPVYLYHSTKWLPYGDLFETHLGFATTVEELPSLISSFQNNWTKEDFLAREERIATYRESHFVKEGAIRQIFAFLAPEHWPFKSDLVCQKLPSSVRMS